MTEFCTQSSQKRLKLVNVTSETDPEGLRKRNILIRVEFKKWTEEGSRHSISGFVITRQNLETY